MNRIVTIAGITLDLSRIRAVRVRNYTEVGKANLLYIEYNSRTEYSKNPFTDEIEKTLINETMSQEVADYQSAREYQTEIEECWAEYLNSGESNYFK